MIYTIKQSQDCTKDGYYVFNLEEIPQEGHYIKMKNMFAKTERQVKKQVANILGNDNFELNIIRA